MGKKPRANKKLNAATDTTSKNPDQTPESLIGSDHCEPELVLVVADKSSKNKSMLVRRSGRLQSLMKPVQNQEVEEIDLVQSEREDDEPQNVEHPLLEPRDDDSINGPTTNQKSLNEKAEDVMKAVDVLKSKVGAQGNDSNESLSVGLIYKSLYLDSQKKIEALTSENHELSRKLEIVLGKLEVYEDINKSQTVIISTMEKAIEALVRSTSLDGQVSSLGGDAGGSVAATAAATAGGSVAVTAATAGGGAVPKELSTKKRRQEVLKTKVVKFVF